MKISAAIPCFNVVKTLARAVASVRAQTCPAAELVVVDDGSTDATRSLAAELGARVVVHAANLGRGAARATAMQECAGEFVLFCDAGIALPSAFVEMALPLMDDPAVAGVFGPVAAGGGTVVERWRARHLFRSGARRERRPDLLATGGALLRRGAVLAEGNFNRHLRSGEDAELGERLNAAGQRVLFDPRLELAPLSGDSVATVLQRYARWNGQKHPSWSDYLRFINYGVKVMMRADLEERDWGAAMISLASPHVLFWHSRRTSNRARPS